MAANTFSALLVAALLSLPASAQSWAEKTFETTSHDFGTIARGAKAEYEFVFSNIYLKEVHIAGASTSCGCTTVRIENSSLKTYEKGAIVASINSQSFLRHQNATITVTFDQPARAKVQLHVKVYVQPDVVVDPGSVELHNVESGVSVEKTVSVSCTRRSDWKILEVKSANPHLSGQVVETARQGNRVSYELRVSLDGKAPPGYLCDHLMLVTNDSTSSQIPVMVRGQVLSPVTVSPSSLFLGVVPAGQKLTKNVVLRGSKPFRIVSVTADCGCFTFGTSADRVAKALHLVPITFTAGDSLGRIARKIRFETDLDAVAAEVSTYAVVTPESG